MTLLKFISKLPDWEILREYATSISMLLGVNFIIEQCCFWKIKKTVPDAINNAQFDKAIFILLNDFDDKITLKKVERLDNYLKVRFLFYIFDEIDKINELEKAYLQNEPDIDDISAGIEKLNILGVFNTVYNLADGDATKFDFIKNMPYGEVFDTQLRRVRERQIIKNKAKIQREKAKKKR